MSSSPSSSIIELSEDMTGASTNCEPSKVSETPPCNDVPVLRRAAMDYLARREHSFYELSQKLQKKFPDTEQELLFEVLEALKAENLQSDERFTESYVRYRTSRGFGYLHIKSDLSSRRVSDSLIHKHLIPDADHWQATADELTAKKLHGDTAIAYGSKQHRKLLRFLESRGFTPIQIRRALEKRLP